MTIHRIGLRPSLGQERSRLNKKRRCARTGSPIPRTLSLLPLEGGGAERRRLASLSFVFDQPPALRASPFHRKGVDFYHLYLLPQKGDRWLSPFSLLPLEGGAPKGRWLASAADGKEMRRCVSSFRHPAMQDLRYPQCLSLTICSPVTPIKKRGCEEMGIHFFTAPSF